MAKGEKVFLGDNLDAEWVSDTVLQIRVDVSKSAGPSASGKTDIIASSHGNQRFTTPKNELVFIGCNIYRYTTEKKRGRR